MNNYLQEDTQGLAILLQVDGVELGCHKVTFQSHIEGLNCNQICKTNSRQIGESG